MLAVCKPTHRMKAEACSVHATSAEQLLRRHRHEGSPPDAPGYATEWNLPQLSMTSTVAYRKHCDIVAGLQALKASLHKKADTWLRGAQTIPAGVNATARKNLLGADEAAHRSCPPSRACTAAGGVWGRAVPIVGIRASLCQRYQMQPLRHGLSIVSCRDE